MSYETSYANARIGFGVAMDLLTKLNQDMVSKGLKPYDLASANPTQSFIQSEVVLSTTTATYHVPIVVNDQKNGQQFVSERRIQLQDIFMPLAIGFYLTVPSAATAPAGKLYSYENLTALGAAPAAAAFIFWDGVFSITINNNQVLPAWDLSQHYKAPITQQAANVDYTASAISLVDSMDRSTDGLVPVAPSFVLNGAANIDANVTLPAALANVATNSRMVMKAYGILLQNVTTVK